MIRFTRSIRIICTITFCLLFAAGCISYQPGPVPTPTAASWKNKNPEHGVSQTPDKWWTIFNDPTLNQLEDEAIANSPSIAIALERLNQARAIYREIRADQFPMADISAFATRERLSSVGIPGLQQPSPVQTTTPGAGPIPGPVALSDPELPSDTPKPPAGATSTSSATQTVPTITATATPHHRTIIQLTPEVTYEVDFWGRYYNATQAALAQVKGEESALATAQLLLTSEVAQQYFTLRIIDADLDLLDQLMQTYRTSMELNRARYVSGLSSDFDPLQAEYAYYSARSSYEDNLNDRVLAEDMLAATIGRPASTFAFAKQPFTPSFITITSPLPAEVLKNRPDVAQAEQLIEQRRCEVGVAKTAFFPSLTLYANAGYQGDSLHSLFKWKNRIWTLTGSAFAPLFEGGRLIAEVDRAKAAYTEAVAKFTDTVITAFREVEDSLTTLSHLTTQYELREKECSSSLTERNLALTLYKQGLQDYSFVITNEQTALTAQRDLLSTSRSRLTQTIALIKSLGGGIPPA